MIDLRPFARLGGANHGWLRARHHFSFGGYHDPARMGLGALRVWNDDEIDAGEGFDPHPHRDMEIITFVRRGAITHTDSLGNTGRTEAGDVQVMHAGTGVVHAEYNHEPGETRIFQIWIQPRVRGVAPGWGSRAFPAQATQGTLVVLADGRDDAAAGHALLLHADAAVMAATLKPGQSVTHRLASGRAAYLVPASGAVTVNGLAAQARDGVAITHEDTVTITATEDAQVVLVDVLG